MASENISRSTVKERLHKWVKMNQPVHGFIEPDEKDKSPESNLLDKAQFKLSHKSRKKKPKVWHLECQWKSEDDFKKHRHWHSEIFTTDWHAGYRFGNKFTTLTGAQYHFKTMRPHTWYNDISGRNWRIRNVITGEMYILAE